MLYDQLDKLTSRSRLLQRALTSFYLAVGVFCGHQRGHWRCCFLRRALWMGPGGDGTYRACFSLLWQHAAGVRSAAGAEHHARRMDFIWRTTKRSVPPNWSNKQDTLRALQEEE